MNRPSTHHATTHGWKAAVRRATPKPLLWKITPMRLSWYIRDAGPGNFGDELGPLLINRIFGIDVKESSISTADMISLGSLLETVEELVEDLSPYVWGTGFIRSGPAYRGRPIRVRAVRGRASLQRLRGIAPESTALGDPGILTSRAFPHLRNADKKYGISIIPHYNDLRSPQVSAVSASPGVHVIDVLRPPLTVVQEIAESEMVCSSSLHGLIVAESFGVPNFWTPLSRNVAGGGYKFEDYYSAFTTDARPVGLADALAGAAGLRRTWRPLPGIHDVQEALIASFPCIPSPRTALEHVGSALTGHRPTICSGRAA